MLSLMLTVSLSFGAGDSSSNRCDPGDVACLHKLLLDQSDEIISLGKRLGLQAERIKSADELIAVYKDAAKEAMAALKPTPMWRDPALWLGIGFLVGGALVLGLSFAVAQAFQLH